MGIRAKAALSTAILFTLLLSIHKTLQALDERVLRLPRGADKKETVAADLSRNPPAQAARAGKAERLTAPEKSKAFQLGFLRGKSDAIRGSGLSSRAAIRTQILAEARQTEAREPERYADDFAEGYVEGVKDFLQ